MWFSKYITSPFIHEFLIHTQFHLWEESTVYSQAICSISYKAWLFLTCSMRPLWLSPSLGLPQHPGQALPQFFIDYYGISCVTLQIYMVKFQPPVSHNVTIFKDEVFKEVINLNKPLRWGPSSVTGVLIRRGETPRMHAHRKAKEGTNHKPRRGASGETKPADTLILGFQSPELWKINFCCLSHPIYGISLIALGN